MIKKLQIKLIAAAMLSLTFVLAVIVGGTNFYNYREVTENADLILSVLAENKGIFPESYDELYIELYEEPYSSYGMWRKEDFLESPELPYESRYFYIILDEEGNIKSTNIEKIAAIDESVASEYARFIWGEVRFLNKNKDSSGFMGNYRYIVHPSDSEVYIVFLDCGRSLKTVKNFAFASIAVSLAGITAVFLILTLISGRIVKPFYENYEKQKRFITDAGHELKTPLAIINADAEVLEMDIGESEWLKDIYSQTKHLSDLTNSLIELSRMEEGDASANMTEFSLSETAEETAASFGTLAKSQNKTLETDIAEGIKIHGDEKAIARLIGILLDNAMKYSEENGKIILTLKEQRHKACLTVYNTTPFIKKENLPHLFDRFYRTDKSRNSQTGGYGLGLSIAASAVSAHKGKITASTEDEKSLLITVVLPI